MKGKIQVIKYYITEVLKISKGIIFKLYVILIDPTQENEDTYRKELVCNILLVFILLLTSILSSLVFISFIDIGSNNYNGISPIIMFLTTGSITCLLYLSRKGYFAIVSEILIWILITGCSYGQITWGADLPSVILIWCFIITASSILISTRYAFILAAAISLGTILFQILENEQVVIPLKAWKTTPFRLDDSIEYSTIFILIAGVSWISNREIFKSLLKVKQSKIELQKERDSLEIKVNERTKELHQAQVDKINSMYQLVEFGRISSGLFHDLMTPLNTLGLAIQQIGNKNNIRQIETQIELCLRTSSRITDFVSIAKRQIQQVHESTKFEINEEIENVITLLQSKARHNNAQLILKTQRNIYIEGSPTLFSHVITNLISNAIDSYSNLSNQYQTSNNNEPPLKHLVLIYSQKKNKQVEIKIKDFGCGIPAEIQSKIFDPFFTTKSTLGCGIGLSATKSTLEKYFNGTISFTSNCIGNEDLRRNSESKIDSQCSTKVTTLGTTFTIKIPIVKTNHALHVNQDTANMCQN
ncbi:MAG: HAMP domain-containing histidine kinase [Candidatus Pacebacteria bacterium]|nr:HAMP domain-containing histidine kinase [Candidatus Paceibacterota bacterium]